MKLSKVGFYREPKIGEIYPSEPKDCKSVWNIFMPAILDEGDCIQINKKYILSIGAHDVHTSLLLSVKHDIDFLTIQDISCFLSYLFDSLVHCGLSNKKKDITSYLSGLSSYFRLIGRRTFKTIWTVQEQVYSAYEAVGDTTGDDFHRVMPFDLWDKGENISCGCEFPNNDKIRRAFFSYKQGLLSIEPQGMILNYWRSIEAVSSLNDRYNLIRSFRNQQLRPVKAIDLNKPNINDSRPKSFNLMLRYKKFIIKYFDKLTQTHGGPENVLDHFYKNRRCPSAHSRTNILEVNRNVSLSSLFNDALLLKYLARCAIEEYWNKI